MRRPETNVLVTGVGAIIGQGIVKSLRVARPDIRIVGVDRSEDGPGRYCCDVFHVKPRVDESTQEYVTFWQQLLQKEDVALVLPGLDVDMHFLLTKKATLEQNGCRIALNNPTLIAQAYDKWLFGEQLHSHGFHRIPATLERSWAGCRQVLGEGPLLLKPRKGNGSRGIARIEDEAEFRYWSRKSDGDFMVQKFIGSDELEFTAGAFGLGGGRSLPPIIFRRRLSIAGNTQFAEVFSNDTLSDQVARLASHFQPLGPTNYQFRMDGDIPYLLEINPRFSSSTSLRTAFGYNEAAMTVAYYLDGVQPTPPNIRPGRAWRYFEDYVTYASDSF